MTMPALISILLGAALGLRFKVLVLLPAIAVTLGPTLVVGIVRGDSPWRIAWAGILVGVGLQVGYLGGTAMRHVMPLVRASRRRAAWRHPPRSLTEPNR